MEVVLRNATLEDVPRLVFLDQEIFGGFSFSFLSFFFFSHKLFHKTRLWS